MRLFEYQRASDLMGIGGMDVVLAHTRTNVGYLVDYYPDFVGSPFFLLDDGTATYLTFAGLPREADREPFFTPWTGEEGNVIAADPWIKDRRFYGCTFTVKGQPSKLKVEADNPVDCVVGALCERGLSKSCIGVEVRHLGVDVFEQLRTALPDATFRDASPILWRLRMIKSAPEIERLKTAAVVTERAVRVAFDGVREGMTDYEFQRSLRAAAAAEGALFDMDHIAFGPQGAVMCFSTGQTAQPGEVIRIELATVVNGYFHVISRVATLGEPRKEFVQAHAAALKTLEAMRNSTRPGVRCCDLYRLGVEIMAEEGYPILGPVLGYATGRDIHEYPFISAGDATPLEAGMVLVYEVPQRIKEVGSISIAHTFLVTEDGLEPISKMDLGIYPAGQGSG
jgi:Xaa-Pro dipeptidase